METVEKWNGIGIDVFGEGALEIVYLHGNDGPLPSALQLPSGFRCYAPHLPGFGVSRDVEGVKDVGDAAFLCKRWIESQLTARPVLIGHDLGGRIGLEIAWRYPQAIQGLILIGSLGLRLSESPPADSFVLEPDVMRDRSWQHKDVAFPQPARSDEQFLVNRAAAARYGWHPRNFDPRLHERLPFIDLPTLVIWGEMDRVVDTTYAEEFAKLIPNAEVAWVPGAGHYPHVEQPRIVGERIADFVSQSSEPKGPTSV